MWSQIERRALVETLTAADPFAPTLCEGWQVRHLAAHLYLRRHRPWSLTGSGLTRVAEAVLSVADLRELVAKFDAPLAPVNPLNLMDRTFGDLANLAEYVIHHEDVRRGDLTQAARPEEREFAEPMAGAILAACGRFARLQSRRVRQGLVFEVPGGPTRVVRTGPDPVTVTGSAADLALLVSGRARAARVTWSGSAAGFRAVFGAGAERA